MRVGVKPTSIAQIAFTEWTDGGALRHARFIRPADRQASAADVRRER
jgi:ATP-dependent DNA ligase